MVAGPTSMAKSSLFPACHHVITANPGLTADCVALYICLAFIFPGKRTEEGFPIYSEAELKLGTGGGE